MAAHLPRRVFAPSFVVTVAAVAMVGCQSQDPVQANSPSASQPSAQPVSSNAPPENPIAVEGPHVNPPPPMIASASPSSSAATPAIAFTEDRAWTVRREANGICDSQEDLACGPHQTCNPPRPSAYDCPTNVFRFPAHVTARKGSTACKVMIITDPSSCPPNADCNPPAPYEVVVACPK